MMVCLANKTFDSTNSYELLKICLGGVTDKDQIKNEGREGRPFS